MNAGVHAVDSETQAMSDPQKIYEALSNALCCSRAWAAKGREKDIPNSTRSARFLSDACRKLDALVVNAKDCNLRSRFIEVDDCGKRHAGEWLLDGVWTEDAPMDDLSKEQFPVRIQCAFECESSTNGRELFRDFSKLIVISSRVKIFAAGINQTIAKRAEDYIRKRVNQIDKILSVSCDGKNATEWYLAFWPSPLNVHGKSLWEHLDQGTFSHLSFIRLYHRVGDDFQEVKAANLE